MQVVQLHVTNKELGALRNWRLDQDHRGLEQDSLPTQNSFCFTPFNMEETTLAKLSWWLSGLSALCPSLYLPSSIEQILCARHQFLEFTCNIFGEEERQNKALPKEYLLSSLWCCSVGQHFSWSLLWTIIGQCGVQMLWSDLWQSLWWHGGKVWLLKLAKFCGLGPQASSYREILVEC